MAHRLPSPSAKPPARVLPRSASARSRGYSGSLGGPFEPLMGVRIRLSLVRASALHDSPLPRLGSKEH